MVTRASEEKRDQARLASDILIGAGGVTGVCVFGSVARGQADRSSDIDILVLGTKPNLTSSRLHAMLPSNLRDGTVAISYFMQEELSHYLEESSRFGVHLQKEGWIVHDRDGVLRKIILENREIDFEREIARQIRLIDALGHVDRFGGRFLFPLAQLYRAARTLAFARLAEIGVFEFDQDVAFSRLAAVSSDWADQVRQLKRISGFYAKTRSSSSTTQLPFDPNGDEAKREFLRARRAALFVAKEDLAVING